jgi:hypothetical protein
MQEHEEAISEVGFVAPHFQEIDVEYDPGDNQRGDA